LILKRAFQVISMLIEPEWHLIKIVERMSVRRMFIVGQRLRKTLAREPANPVTVFVTFIQILEQDLDKLLTICRANRERAYEEGFEFGWW
jgi:hypothetical protein